MISRLQQIISESGYLGFVKRVVVRARRESHICLQLARNTCQGSYQKNNKYFFLHGNISSKHSDLRGFTDKIPDGIIGHYLEHRFDLLGSGWVRVCYGMPCRGLEQYRFKMGSPVHIDAEGKWLEGRINRTNLLKAQQIWQHIDPDYKPIDWQLDFKSGFRWSERQYSKKIKFGDKLGADVKVPWELARMQHLPQLAWACLSLELTDGEKYRIQHEYKNQVLDFIATNPPGFGVNWVCPMDIAIRAANWVLAWDLFHAGHEKFPQHFETLLTQSIYEHGLYVINNLEWSPNRANHYLANIAGLAFIAAYLPSDEETDTWLAFAVQELVVEVDRQFGKDGGNFEGSTAYHRLSAEMVYYATALLLGLPKERLKKLQCYNQTLFKTQRTNPRLQVAPLPLYRLPNEEGDSLFPQEYLQTLERMAEFIMDITKPDGRILQIGDNDSGRFFKLQPVYQKITVKEAREQYANLDDYADFPDNAAFFREDTLNCHHLVAAGYGFFGRSDFADWLGGEKVASCTVDTGIIRALSDDKLVAAQRTLQRVMEDNIFFEEGSEDIFNEHLWRITQAPNHQVQKKEFTVTKGDLLEDLTLRVYPDFGLFIFKSSRLYLIIRCWIGSRAAHSSHRHHDQLSVELSLDGANLLCDPGTYLYTPLPSERHLYRENKGHFSPFSSFDSPIEPGMHVFSELQPEPVQVSYSGRKGFMAKTTSTAQDVQLLVSLGNKSIVIYHANYSLQEMQASNLAGEKKLPFSPGYGVKYR